MNIVDLKEIPEIIPMLSKWHHNQWSYFNPGTTLESRITKMQKYLNKEFIPSTFVAVDSNVILGSAAIVAHDMKTRMEYSPWLASLFVPPEHRKKGIGSKLVLHVEIQSAKNGIETLYLFTPDKQNYYKKLGWSEIHIEQFNGIEVDIMNKNFHRYQISPLDSNSPQRG